MSSFVQRKVKDCPYPHVLSSDGNSSELSRNSFRVVTVFERLNGSSFGSIEQTYGQRDAYRAQKV